MAYPLITQGGLPTLFGEISEKNVSFLIDTSGSMYNFLDTVKDHLIESLMKRAYMEDTMFNIIEFNSEVTQWADKMVKCNPQTVKVAAQWIKKLSPKTGTNTQDALLTAFSDQSCEAVYLVTDGLPDQHPTDILDHVSYAGQGRPVHCIYLTGASADSAATEFLQDLATETYGSFHIVTITTHGCVEKITPIYRADHGLGTTKIIRTNEGRIFSTDKICSITTTLAVEPEPVPIITAPIVVSPSRVVVSGNTIVPTNYSVAAIPTVATVPISRYTWARYRPARAWLKEQERDPDDSSIAYCPAAGALLIGNRVLARRLEDGLYYLATVKSQVMSDKFLLEFGPCKHGKFRDTVYQETNVYDIISYADSLRHAIIPGDKVLAPWEPEGERFGPGTVIRGTERRFASGTATEEMLVVTFHNGRTESVPRGKAVWIPPPLFERVNFEIKMPPSARKSLEIYGRYPQETLEGYPTSGPVATPEEFDTPKPLFVDRTSTKPQVVADKGLFYHPDYVPMYPAFFRHMEKPSVVKSEDMDKLIEGTGMTREQLNEKVMSQIMENKMVLENQKEASRIKEHDRRIDEQKRAILYKRQKEAHKNRLRKQRSVEFTLPYDDLDLEVQEYENTDSGIGTETSSGYYDTSNKFHRHYEDRLYNDDTYFSDYDYYDYSDSEDKGTQTRSSREVGVGTHSWPRRTRSPKRTKSPSRSLVYRPCSKLRSKSPVPIDQRPDWKYWPNSPSPELIAPPKHGGFRETALQAPLECREQRIGPYGHVEWSDTMYNHANPNETTYQKMVKENMKMMPSPPEKNSVSKSADFRQKRMQQTAPRGRMFEILSDNHRERLRQQYENEKAKEKLAYQQVQATRDAKKMVSSEIKTKIESHSHQHEPQRAPEEREQQRIDSMRARHNMRENSFLQTEAQKEARTETMQAAKDHRAQQRFNEVHNRLLVEEYQQAARDDAKRRAYVARREHFRKLEEDAQKKKDLRIGVTDMHLAMYRSQVLH